MVFVLMTGAEVTVIGVMTNCTIGAAASCVLGGIAVSCGLQTVVSSMAGQTCTMNTGLNDYGASLVMTASTLAGGLRQEGSMIRSYIVWMVSGTQTVTISAVDSGCSLTSGDCSNNTGISGAMTSGAVYSGADCSSTVDRSALNAHTDVGGIKISEARMTGGACQGSRLVSSRHCSGVMLRDMVVSISGGMTSGAVRNGTDCMTSSRPLQASVSAWSSCIGMTEFTAIAMDINHN